MIVLIDPAPTAVRPLLGAVRPPRPRHAPAPICRPWRRRPQCDIQYISPNCVEWRLKPDMGGPLPPRMLVFCRPAGRRLGVPCHAGRPRSCPRPRVLTYIRPSGGPSMPTAARVRPHVGPPAPRACGPCRRPPARPEGRPCSGPALGDHGRHAGGAPPSAWTMRHASAPRRRLECLELWAPNC